MSSPPPSAPHHIEPFVDINVFPVKLDVFFVSVVGQTAAFLGLGVLGGFGYLFGFFCLLLSLFGWLFGFLGLLFGLLGWLFGFGRSGDCRFLCGGDNLCRLGVYSCRQCGVFGYRSYRCGINRQGSIGRGAYNRLTCCGGVVNRNVGRFPVPQAENVAAIALTTSIASADLNNFFILIYPFGIVNIFAYIIKTICAPKILH